MIYDTGEKLYEYIKNDQVDKISEILEDVIKNSNKITSLYLNKANMMINLSKYMFFKEIIFESMKSSSQKSFDLFIDTISSNPKLIDIETNDLFKLLIMIRDSGTEKHLNKLLQSDLLKKLDEEELFGTLAICINYKRFNLFNYIVQNCETDLNNALCEFVKKGRVRATKHLLDMGVNPKLSNKTGISAFEIAKKKNAHKLVQILTDNITKRNSEIITKEIIRNAKVVEKIKKKRIQKIKGFSK